MTEPRVHLADLGWDESWQEALASRGSGTRGWLDPGQEPGRIIRVDRGLCLVVTASGGVRASLGGDVLDALAHDPLAGPCTGDWCLVRHWPDGPITVDMLAARRTLLVRADPSKSSRGQALAANMDLVGLVVGLHPEPNLMRIERLLAIGWQSGADPVVLLTKTDLVGDGEAIAEDVRAAAPGVAVQLCSGSTGQGVAEIRVMLGAGRTMALVGASGHGKSTLANALVGADVLPTRSIRDDGKGRHTSVRRELLVLPGGGAVIDTPGLRGVGLQQDDGALNAAFPDVDVLTAGCRFRDCAHNGEPGCAVAEAVASGQLSVRRWESWQRLKRDLERAEARARARVRSEQGSGRHERVRAIRAGRRSGPRR